ncbi:MAG TPA: hypothetical protein VKA46_14960 [Gemmataceae bacterium]|nr:hypothetical protein [Gemmataceae bacterium]
MWQSQVIREWKAEARLEEKRAHLLRLLRKRFPPEVPTDLALMIEQTADPEILTRWFDYAATTTTLDAFRNAVQAPAPSTAQNS